MCFLQSKLEVWLPCTTTKVHRLLRTALYKFFAVNIPNRWNHFAQNLESDYLEDVLPSKVENNK